MGEPSCPDDSHELLEVEKRSQTFHPRARFCAIITSNSPRTRVSPIALPKTRQLLIGAHDEMPSIATMYVSNPVNASRRMRANNVANFTLDWPLLRYRLQRLFCSHHVASPAKRSFRASCSALGVDDLVFR